MNGKTIGFMRITIDANNIHLDDKLIVQDVENRKEFEIDLREVRKIKEEKLIIVTSKNGSVFRFGWFETLLINRPLVRE